eukprot:s1276_g35.t1
METLHSLGFAYVKVEDIQVCRKRGAIQPSRWCSAFVTLKSYEQVGAAVFAFDGSYMPKLSSRVLFAERAVPRMTTLMEQGQRSETTSTPSEPHTQENQENYKNEEDTAATEFSGVSVAVAHFLEVKQEEKEIKRMRLTNMGQTAEEGSTLGSGRPDQYIQQLIGTIFGMLQKKDEENEKKASQDQETKGKKDTTMEQQGMPSDSQGDQEENPVELCFFGMNDFTESTEPATSSGSNMPAQSPDDAMPKTSTTTNKKKNKGKGAKRSKK